MTWISKLCIRKLLPVSAFIIAPVAIATADPHGLASESPPLTMARFYVVDSDGRSVSDQSIPTQPRSQDQPSLEAWRKKSDPRQRYLANNAGERSDSGDLIRVRSNAMKAWQCEQHGFFFTSDGRCVRPVIHVKPVAPPTTSRPPIRRNLSSR